MSFKTILVHVDESKHLQSRVEIAAKIAMAENAHLIGAAATGVSRFIRDTVAVDPEASSIGIYLDILRKRAEGALNSFENIARSIGVNSIERRMIDDDAAEGVSTQARYCDLTVLGQEDPDERSPALMPGFPGAVVMTGGGPSLIIPYAGNFTTVGQRVLIAWNASGESLRAVRGALPLLKRASIVQVVSFNPSTQADVYGQDAGVDIALYLARHEVKVDVMQEEIGANVDIGNALLSLAANLGSDMLVMGCYGHSRVREVLFGGATYVVLKSMTVPVLMAH